MLLILLSWIYILAISITIGITINKGLKIYVTDIVIIILLGFFSITLFTGFWAIFFAVSWQFHVVLLCSSAIALKYNGLAIRSYFENLKKEILGLSSFFKIAIGFALIVILGQCASPPLIIDNESYYIQTIKWLNEYGLVKGLVNLHLFLGQTSGWHILQSAFSFSFIYDSFNDISGLCLLLGNYFAIVKLNQFCIGEEKNKLNLIVSLFPVFNVFLFQFIAAPSPDIAVYVIGLIVFYLFIESYTNYARTSFLAISVLSIFLVLIKLSAFFFLAFPLVLLVKHYSLAKKNCSVLFVLGSLTVLFIVVKNIIITGNAIYPLASIESLSFDWHLSKTVETYFHDLGLTEAYNLTPEAFKDASVLEVLKHWLLQTNLNGLFNGLMLLLLLVSPWFILKSTYKKPLFVIYVTAFVSLIVLFFISPQYRFFLPFILMLSLFLLSSSIYKQKAIKAAIVLTLSITIIPLIFSMNLMVISDNNLHKTNTTFSLNYLIEPHSNSRYTTDYKTIQLENTSINTPTQIDFFWATGNTPIPTVNTKQLEYFKTYFKVIPQQRTKDLNDGFFSKKVE